MSASTNNKFVKPGIYEIQSSATSLFLNPPNGSGDRLEALTLNRQGLRAGMWEIAKIGDGYTIRQVISGLFCALQNPVNCLDEPVVLSSMPTIWVIDMEDESEQIWISCPISHLAWEIMGTSESPEVGMGTPYIAHELPQKSFLWRLKPVREPSFSGKLAPGSYSIQNKASGTYVKLGDNGKTIECSPRNPYYKGERSPPLTRHSAALIGWGPETKRRCHWLWTSASRCPALFAILLAERGPLVADPVRRCSASAVETLLGDLEWSPMVGHPSFFHCARRFCFQQRRVNHSLSSKSLSSAVVFSLSRVTESRVLASKDQFRANNTKIWEIIPLGEGYSIRLLGADKYCTLEPGGVFKGNEIYLSPFPAAWKIVPNDSAMHSTGEEYFQIFWGDTNLTWDLSGYGNKASGTPIYLQSRSDFQECRLFKFVL